MSRIERLLNQVPEGVTPPLRTVDPVPQAADRAVQDASPVFSSPPPAGDGSSPPSPRSGGSSSEGKGGAQNAVPSQPPFDFDRFYNDPRWWDDATEFEQRLGAYYFNDAQTVDAARTALHKLRDVLMKLVPKQPGESAEAFAARVESVFFKDDPTSAGQVGTRAGLTVDDLLAHGNLRELVTAFYNGAYYNRDNPNTLSHVLLRVMDDGDWDRAREAGLEVAEVQRAHHQLDGRLHRPVLGWLESKLMEGSFTFARDPFGTGNVGMLSERGARDVAEVIMSQYSRENRSEEEIQRLGLNTTPAHYEGLGVPLGRFERAFVEEQVGGELAPDTPLPWREGVTAHETTTSRWAQKAMSEGFPVVDGVSGTTARMLTAAKFLNLGPETTERFLGALMGWMLPGRDHSLLEICRGAQIASVGGMRLEPASRPTAVNFYRNLPGLDLGVLRREILADGMFPHEHGYFVNATRSDGFLETQDPEARTIVSDLWAQFESGRVADPDLVEWLERSGIDPKEPAQVKALGERLSPAHLMALNVYTRSSHSLINNVTRAHLWTGGLSESVPRYLMMNKAEQLVRGYLDGIAAGADDLRLPVALHRLVHVDGDHADFASSLSPLARSYVEAVRRVGELGEVVTELKEAYGARGEAWRGLKERIGEAVPELWDEMRWHADLAYDWTRGSSESMAGQRQVVMDKAEQLVRGYLDGIAAGADDLRLPVALHRLVHVDGDHADFASSLSPLARSYVEAVRRVGELGEVVTELREARGARGEAWRGLKERIGEAVPELWDEMRWHADMIYDALAQLPAVGSPEKPVQAYRGDWMTPVHSPIYGSDLYPYGTAREFLSLSRDLEVAIDFMVKNPGGDRKILTVYRLTGQQAKDISIFSSFPDQQEIILPPYSRMRRVGDPVLIAEIREKVDRLISDMLGPGHQAPKYEIIVMEES